MLEEKGKDHDHDNLAGQPQRTPQAQAHDEGARETRYPPSTPTRTSNDYDAVLAPAKLFSPYNGWTWYITEWDAETGLCFGLVEGFETELGYFDLTELAEVTVFGSVPAVERDLYWKPTTLGEIKRQSRGMAA